MKSEGRNWSTLPTVILFLYLLNSSSNIWNQHFRTVQSLSHFQLRSTICRLSHNNFLNVLFSCFCHHLLKTLQSPPHLQLGSTICSLSHINFFNWNGKKGKSKFTRSNLRTVWSWLSENDELDCSKKPINFLNFLGQCYCPCHLTHRNAFHLLIWWKLW